MFHNRLTHSFKVAQVGRRLAEALKERNRSLTRPSIRVEQLDADSPEAACLAHDLGHPPFGHVAEDELDHLAGQWGGFEGNAQSFRIVTQLALRDVAYRGLNLTRTTLNGILKYPWLKDSKESGATGKWGAYDSETEYYAWARKGSLGAIRSTEAELMDWADDITYAVHDLEDFYRVGLVPLDRLTVDDAERERFIGSLFEDTPRKLLKERLSRERLTAGTVFDAAEFLFGGGFLAAAPYTGRVTERVTTRERSSALIDRYISSVRVRAKREPGQHPVIVDHQARAEVAVLKELTWYYVIRRPSLETLHRGQRKVIRTLHRVYSNAARAGDFALFPEAQQDELQERPEDLRIVTDFVASLTEPLAYELYHRLTGLAKGSILDAAARQTG